MVLTSFTKCEGVKTNTKSLMTVKNTSKGASFSYAFKRINDSIKAEYYLEAVTLAESIISDRLLSFVQHHKKTTNVKTPFYKLIRLGEKYNKVSFTNKKGIELFDALNSWRIERNKCIHSVAKSEPGQPTRPVDEFVNKSKEAAINGKALARLICDWHRENQK